MNILLLLAIDRWKEIQPFNSYIYSENIVKYQKYLWKHFTRKVAKICDHLWQPLDSLKYELNYFNTTYFENILLKNQIDRRIQRLIFQQNMTKMIIIKILVMNQNFWRKSFLMSFSTQTIFCQLSVFFIDFEIKFKKIQS